MHITCADALNCFDALGIMEYNMNWKNVYFGGAMKRLIKSILTILALGWCLGLAGNMLKGIAEVAADSNYSIEQKRPRLELWRNS